jgi:hypothetical protein
MEDDRLVQLALSRGCVTQEQIDRAKAEQKALADRGIDHGVYFLLQDLGFLSEGDARDLRRSVSSSAIRALEVDGFVIQGRLGSGGMGDVFRAGHPDGRIAAVKLLSSKLAKSEEYVRRFLREGRAMQRLQHPNIVGVYGAGESLGTRYILMELVDGPSLKSWLVERGRLEVGHALVVLRHIAHALEHAQRHGVLHRDVKPANIILGPPRPGIDEPFCAKLCDFGLARVEAGEGDPDLSRGGLTGTGLALGTPHYMSPEQASGEHDLDQRADIYGLGASIYHALLGQTMYSGKSSAVIMYKQVTETVDLQLLRTAGIDERLVGLLGRMLEKRRSARIATWMEVLATLGEGPSVQPATVAPASAETAGAAPTGMGQPAVHAELTPAPAPAAAPRRLMPMVLATLGIAALLAALVVGLLLRSGPTVLRVTPSGLTAAVAAAASASSARTLQLEPGIYQISLRLGAAHRGLHLQAAGPGVVLEPSGNGPVVLCEPGLTGARLSGLTIRAASGRVAIEAIGGGQLQLTSVEVRGGVVVGGGMITGDGVGIDGAVMVADRGLLHLGDATITGLLTADRGEVRLRRSTMQGGITLRQSTAVLDSVRCAGPGLTIERGHTTLREVHIAAHTAGLQARSAELPEIVGLTIEGAGPSIVWEGDRAATWRWERFQLASPTQGAIGGLPAGPGADQALLPLP